MIESSDVQGLTKSIFPLLAGDPVFEKEFFRYASLMTLDAGAVVCQEGNRCDYLPLILDGSARVFKLSEGGREITLYRMEAGDSCILTASCILSQSPFPALAETEVSTRALLIPSMQVDDWIRRFDPWRSFIFGLIALRLSNVIALVNQVAFGRLDDRLIKFLSDKTDQEGWVTITHQQIADELGSSREVITRVLNNLQRNKVLKITRGAIQLLDE